MGAWGGAGHLFSSHSALSNSGGRKFLLPSGHASQLAFGEMVIAGRGIAGSALPLLG